MSCAFFFDTTEYAFGRQTKPDYLIEQIQADLRVSLRLYELEKGHWAAHKAAPFGFVSIDKQTALLRTDNFANTLKILVSDLVDQLIYNLIHERKAKSINLSAFPRMYDAQVYDVFADALMAGGFALNKPDDIAYLIEISKEETFYQKIDSDQRYKIRKAIAKGFVFDQEPLRNLPEIWELLKSNRATKSYHLSLDYNQMLSHFVHFPGRYLLFSVRTPTTALSAIGIAVWVSTDILYVFYVADALEYRKYSPVVLLYQGIYNYALKHGARMMDLGCATLNGVPNQGLSAFKKSLGTKSSPKRNWNWSRAD